MILYLPNEHIPVKIGDAVFYVQPLTQAQKDQLIALAVRADKGNDEQAAIEGTRKAVKFALKKVDGIFLSDGSEYQVKVKDGQLTDECLAELENLPCNQQLQLTCMQLITNLQSLPPGVEIVKPEGTPKRKKK